MLDWNRNGQIDSGRELFGDNTQLLDDGTKASNGFQALAGFDDNSDGVINYKDEIFYYAQIFKDTNQNGTAEEGELLSLSQAGISSINLNYRNSSYIDENDNAHRLVGSFVTTDGETRDMTDVYFALDTEMPLEELLAVPDDILALPDAAGYGTVHSLHQAMVRDTTGTLQSLVESFVACTGREERLQLVKEIIFVWTGQANVDPDKYVAAIDAREIGVISAFYGTQLAPPNGSAPGYVNTFHGLFEKICDNVFYVLMEQTHLDSLYDLVTFTYDSATECDIGSYANAIPLLVQMVEANPEKGQDLVQDFVQSVRGLNPYEPVSLDILKNQAQAFINNIGPESTISRETLGYIIGIASGASDLNDTIYGKNNSADVIYGLDGDDRIEGCSGNDVIDGGRGNDFLKGDAGDDVYVFGNGYGHDRINNFDTTTGRHDIIRFTEGITFNDIQLSRSGDDLVIEINGTDDQLRVESHFAGDMAAGYAIDELQFSDGSSFDASAANLASITEYVQVITEGNDELHGYSTSDSLNGLGGNDKIFGKDGNDTLDGSLGNDNLSGDGGDDVLMGGDGNDALDGGDGNDSLNGGSGNDTLTGGTGNNILVGGTGDDFLKGGVNADIFRYALGDGLDIIESKSNVQGSIDAIEFASDISTADVQVKRLSDDLVMDMVDGGQIRVRGYFSNQAVNDRLVHEIRFSDQTVWTVDYIKSRCLDETEAADTIQGYSSDDSINGLAGNDTVSGNSGNDTINGGAGDDYLQGGEGNDDLIGGSGNDYMVGGNGNDIYRFEAGFGQDSISSSDTTAGRIDVIEFGSGICPDGITARRNSYNLILTVNGTTDQITVHNYFYIGGGLDYSVNEIRFDDGTVWTVDTVNQKVIVPTDGNDLLYGYAGDDSISGLGGDDSINGNGGNDALDGGLGIDKLYGGTGNDVLAGGAGNDSLYGDDGNDSLSGGEGNDVLTGGNGNDIYRFEAGFGQDTINNNDYTSGRVDVIEFGNSINPSQITALRNNTNLVLTVNSTTDQITVTNYFDNDGAGDSFVNEIRFSDGTVWTVDTVNQKVLVSTESNDTLYGNAGDDTISGLGGDDSITGNSGNDNLEGGSGADKLYGNDGNDSLMGGDGNDTLSGGNDSDTLSGGAGADSLNGEYGSDVLIGGAGNDALNGGSGNDIYRFEAGFGQDTITNNDTATGRMDVIEFGASLSAADIVVRRNSYNLVLTVNGTTDQITVLNYFSGEGAGSSHINEIRFQDGTVWTVDTVMEKALIPTEGNDTLYGYAGDDNISGLGGDDVIFGNDGNDTLDGGVGADNLYGYEGNDSLVGGEGNDIFYGGNDDDIMFGSIGNDTLNGEAGNDILIGGVGNDALNGGSGNDIYRFETGFGQDTITNNDTSTGRMDVIEFGASLSAADIVVRRNSYNLVLTVNGTTDQITVSNYFSGEGARSSHINEIRFQDGTVWTVDTVMEKALIPTEGNDTLYGYVGDDNISGLGGDDVLFGNDGNDTLDGGVGADNLYGYEGNDSLVGGDGNDIFYGGNGDDIMFGSIGNDTLNGETGNDILFGGVGNDALNGGSGNDIYRFETGFGQDTIINNDTASGRVDVIEFGVGISAESIIARRSSSSLILSVNGTTDQVTISNYFSGETIGGYYINEIRFQDGPIWTVDMVKEKVLLPTEGNDTINGYATDEMLSGLGGDDYLYGNGGNDTLDGGLGIDRVYGNDGNDQLLGGDGNDNLSGGNNDDTLSGGSGADSLYGDAGNDLLMGDAGNDTLNGGTDSDILSGGAGNDALDGGTGNDIYRFEAGFGQDTINNYDTGAGRLDVIEFGVGIAASAVFARRNGDNLILSVNGTTDQITVQNYFNNDGAGSYVINEIRFNDGTVWNIDIVKHMVLVPTEGNDSLYGYAGNDQVSGDGGIDTLYGYAGNDILDGGVGNDQIYGGNGDDTLTGGVGNDSLIGDVGNDVMDGGTGTDNLTGGDGNDVLAGGDDNDTLYGGNNNDTLSGGAGNDTLGADSGNDILHGNAGNDILDGGSGNDIYRFEAGFGQDTINNNDAGVGRIDVIEFGEGILSSGITVLRSGNTLTLKVNGTTDQITVSNYFTNDGASPYVINEIRFADGTVWNVTQVMILSNLGTEGNDNIYGAEGNDYLYGLGGDDLVYGYGGNDQLNGGAGNDMLYGNDGNDSLSGGDSNDTLSGGNHDDTLYGGAGVDTLNGDAGIDELDGGTGNDNLTGGDGNDNLTGGEDNDNLSGGNNDDTLYGGRGNDTVNGDTGNDVLYGDAGNDALNGGAGNDIYRFEAGFGQDTISNYDAGSGRIDAIEFGTGISAANITARRSGENLILTVNGTSDQITISNYFNIAGIYVVNEIRFSDSTVWSVDTVKQKVLVPTEGSDMLYGYDVADTLSGLGGDDTLTGNGGNDQIDGGAGNDQLNGNDGNDILSGGDSNDNLSGGNNDDTLYGGAGADTLNGDAGIDVLDGGTGNDNLTGGEGNDNLSGGEDNDTLYGGNNNDTLYGGAGYDTLNGDAGNDVLYGEAGNDALNGGAGNDIYRFEVGFGQDTINNYDTGAGRIDAIVFGTGISAENITARRTGDNLILTVNGSTDRITISNYFNIAGTYVVNEIRFSDSTVWSIDTVKQKVVVPTEGSDMLYGYDIADTMSGLGGDDTLTGNGGNDTLDGGAGNDQLNGNDGNDLLSGGDSNDNLSGGNNDDTLYGGAGADTLNGDAGVDVLDGGTGNDYLTGGDGNDSLLGGDEADMLSGGNNNDTLYGGAGYDTLNGDAGNDVLYGDAGNDALNGGTGNDIYRFEAGFGQDTISNYDTSVGRIDAIVFGTGISAENITARRINDNLILVVNGTSDQITISNYFNIAGIYTVNEIRFSDSTVWSVDTVKQKVIISTESNDNLTGYDVADTLSGLGGDDILTGNGGNDSLDGGAGNDQLNGNDGNDLLSGGDSNDILYGGNNDDTLYGGAGADTLNGDAGIDILDGGAGNDNLTGGDGNDSLSGGEENDVLYGGNNNDTLYGGAGIDTLSGDAGNDVLYGDAGNDQLNGGSEDDTLYGGAGEDALTGGTGNDILCGDAGKDSFTGGAGNDIYRFEAGFGQDTINNYDTVAGRIDAILFGSSLSTDDISARRNGNDLILKVINMSDQITVSNYFMNEGVSAYVVNEIRFNDGTVWALDTVKQKVTPLPGLGGDNTLNGTSGNDLINGEAGNDNLTGVDGNDTLTGGEDNDTLSGGNNDDSLYGGMGNDTLNGNTGNDVLYGDVGYDALNGGAGNDIYRFEAGFGQDTINNYDAGVGRIDAIEFGSSIAADQINACRNGDNLILTVSGTADQVTISNYFYSGGSYAVNEIRFSDSTVWTMDTVKQKVLVATEGSDVLTGYDVADTLSGLGGDDTLTGNAGNDTLDGGAGNDMLNGNDGNDILSGGDSNDTLYGGNNDDALYGGAGADTLNGDAGIDVLDGGTGNDNLTGGDGNDTLTGGEDNDTLAGGNHDDTLYGGRGNDTVSGDAGNDVLYGDVGNDALNGGAGNDIYRFEVGFGQDTISNYDAGVGRIDAVVFGAGIAAENITARRNGDNLILTVNGTSDQVTISNYFNIAGSYVVNEIRFNDGAVWTMDTVKQKALVSSESNDMLYGYDVADTLSGLGGDDALTGNAGNDTLDGGAGNDQLNGNDGNDILSGGESNDTLYGGNNDDTLYGGSGADTLNGDAGIDVLDGGTGNDNLTGGDGNDTLLGGDETDMLYGGNNDDTLFGGAGNDTVNGDAGNDVLYGDGGNDTLTGGAGNDIYRFEAGFGQDTISNYDTGAGRIDAIVFGTGITAANITARRTGDNLIFTVNGTSDQVTISNYFNIAGSYVVNEIRFSDSTVWSVDTVKQKVVVSTEVGDTLTGYDVADTLSGLGGDDTLTGNAGNDTLDGGAGNDQIYGNDGNDILSGGESNDTLYGGNNDDTLYGGAGADTLNGDAGVDMLDGGTGNDNLTGGDGSDTLLGGDETDTLYGGNNDDILYGGTGNDNLNGDAGNDALYGDAGNDTLTGGAGNDIYRFEAGFGQDTISNYDAGVGRIDAVVFGAGITAENITARRTSDNLILTVNGTGDQVTITNYFNIAGTYAVNEIRFSDSTVWSVDTVKQNVIVSTESNDMLYGYDVADTLSGLGGDDTLTGNAGNDTLDGGAGNDTLNGNDGNDNLSGGESNDTLYGGNNDDALYGGAGADTLNGDAGIDVLDGGTGNDNLTGGDGNDTLTGGDDADTLYGGNNDDILYGGTGYDNLNGDAGNDVLYGDAGNDALSGGAGNDIYRFSAGFGQDTLSDSAGTDAIQFMDGILKNDIALFRNGANLYLSTSGGNQITVQNQTNANYTIETIQLADGSYLTSSDVNLIIQQMTAFSTDHGITVSNVNDVRNNQDLMNIIVSSWKQS